MEEWEREERWKRKTSVIVHGMEESEAMDAVERRGADRRQVADMFRELDCGEVRMDNFIMLGKKGVPMNGEEPRPRPLKLVLESEEMKLIIKTPQESKKLEEYEGRRLVKDLCPPGHDPIWKGGKEGRHARK